MPSTDTLTILLNFGNNVKVQLATASLFDIIRQFGSHLKEGWKNVSPFFLFFYFGLINQFFFRFWIVLSLYIN